jgi:hypothetical protein
VRVLKEIISSEVKTVRKYKEKRIENELRKNIDGVQCVSEVIYLKTNQNNSKLVIEEVE